MKENDLLNNLDKIHTTELGQIRIKRNLKLECDDVVQWCMDKLNSGVGKMFRKGKNWYVEFDDFVMTINAYSYTIITAHMKRVLNNEI